LNNTQRPAAAASASSATPQAAQNHQYQRPQAAQYEQHQQQQRQPAAPQVFMMRDAFGNLFRVTQIPDSQEFTYLPQAQHMNMGAFSIFDAFTPVIFTNGAMFNEAFIEEFLRNDPNNYGPAPASKEAINKLKKVSFDSATACGDSSCCPVCFDNYKQDEKLVELPCKHRYHKDCVTTWLAQHNSCPMCRAQI